VDHNKNIELYSPTGNCNHKLAAFPMSCFNNVLIYVDEMIISCCGGESCWEYSAKENNWSVIATAPFSHNNQPGVVYQEKVYVMDEPSPKVLDPSSKTWSSWPSPPNKSGHAPSMVGWKDCIILLGGKNNLRGVQIFNITKQTWTALDSSQVPMDMSYSSTLTLSNGEVFIVGSDQDAYINSSAFYNPGEDSWVKLKETIRSRQGARLVLLGSKIFVVGGRYSGLVEEFLLKTNAWKPVDAKLIISRNYMSVIALPAKLFSHLQGGCQGVN